MAALDDVSTADVLAPLSRRIKLAVLAIVLVALGVRVSGIFGQGYPHSYYADEVSNVDRAVQFYDLDQGGLDLDPGWFNKPALGYYLLFGEYGVYYLWGRHVGDAWDSPREFAGSFVADHGPFYVIGRFSNCVFGALTAWMVFLLGWRVWGRSTGLLAAAAFAVCAPHVAWCQVVKQDAPSTFCLAAALAAAATAWRTGRPRGVLVAGALVGLGMATKYYPVVAAPSVAVAAFALPLGWALRARAALLSAVLAIVVFIVGTPFNLLNPAFRERNLASVLVHADSMLAASGGALAAVVFVGVAIWFLARRRARGAAAALALIGVFGLAAGVAQAWPVLSGEVDPNEHGIVGQMGRGIEVLIFGQGWGHLMKGIERPPGITVPVGGLFLVGLLVALRRGGRIGAALVVLPLPTLLVFLAILSPQHPKPNHLTLAHPTVCLVAAHALMVLARRISPTRATLMSWCGLLLFFVLPLPHANGGELVRMIGERNAVRSETAALAWLEENVPAGSTIFNDTEVLPVTYTRERHDWIVARFEAIVAGSERVVKEARVRVEEGQRELDAGPDAARAEALSGRIWADRRAIAEHETRLRQDRRRLVKHRLLRDAAHTGVPFDAFAVLKSWQGENRQQARNRSYSYSPLWPRFPLETPADLPPVERYRAAIAGDVGDTGLGFSPVLAGRGPDFLVSRDESYLNFRVNPKKRPAWPVWTAFYDDLLDHYPFVEINGEGLMPGPVLRIFDLRKRRP